MLEILTMCWAHSAVTTSTVALRFKARLMRCAPFGLGALESCGLSSTVSQQASGSADSLSVTQTLASEFLRRCRLISRGWRDCRPLSVGFKFTTDLRRDTLDHDINPSRIGMNAIGQLKLAMPDHAVQEKRI